MPGLCYRILSVPRLPAQAFPLASDVCAQASGPMPPYSSAGAINLGGRGWSGSESRHAVPESAKSQLEFEVRGGLASDYVSARPAVANRIR
jgi:hypothetical protein